MNQGRIWCVVHPTVGLPLLLGSVTTIALIVHASVLTHTNWMSSYWAGGSKAKSASNETATSVAALSSKTPGFSITVKPVAATDGGTQTAFVVTVGSDAKASAPLVTDDTAARPSPGHLAMAQPPTR